MKVAVRHGVIHRPMFALGLGVVAAAVSTATMIACGGHHEEPLAEPLGQEIVGGTEARGYESAALLDMPIDESVRRICSGSLIAPRVILTAGHCVTNAPNGFDVTLPYANAQRIHSSLAGVVFDYVETSSQKVDPKLHDIGLVILDTPATLSSWPKLARSPVEPTAGVVKVGRIDNGVASTTSLFKSQPMVVSPADQYGFSNSYVSGSVIQKGDSGGPCFLDGASPPTIVAVNSGSNLRLEVLARVDLLADWIDERVAEYGGYADVADGGAPADAGPGRDAGEPEGNSTDSGATDGGTEPEGAAPSDGRSDSVDEPVTPPKRRTEARTPPPATIAAPKTATEKATEGGDTETTRGCAASPSSRPNITLGLGLAIGLAVAIRRRRST